MHPDEPTDADNKLANEALPLTTLDEFVDAHIERIEHETKGMTDLQRKRYFLNSAHFYCTEELRELVTMWLDANGLEATKPATEALIHQIIIIASRKQD